MTGTCYPRQWFVEITRKKIRCGVFKSLPEPVAVIEDFIRLNNAHPKPFVWTRNVKEILDKVGRVGRCKAIVETRQ